MNITVSHAEYSSPAEMRAAYQAQRKRLWSVKKPEPRPKTTIRVTDIGKRPMWRKKPTMFNDHIIAWQMHRAAKAMSPVPAFIATWCEANGTTPVIMTGHDRHRPVASLRHLLIYELRSNFDLSLPQLGRIFGGRDHTTIFNSLQKAEILKERGLG